MKNRSLLPPVTVVATAGPALFRVGQLREIARLGRIIFRVNGAHGSVKAVGETILKIRKALPSSQVLLDLPGRKIRLTHLDKPIQLRAAHPVRLNAELFNAPNICLFIRKGQMIIANDGRTKLVVAKRSKTGIELIPENDGLLNPGKGIHVGEALAGLPFFAARDLELLQELPRWPATHIGLSFVCSPEDIETARRSMAKRRITTTIIPKIETAAAMVNLKQLLPCADTFLLDRGDLASEIGLELLPAAQERVLRETAAARVRLIVATQLLKNMEEHPIPLIAELTEIHRLLERGIFGLQLSEETAVGKHPADCVRLIMNMSRRIVESGPNSEVV